MSRIKWCLWILLMCTNSFCQNLLTMFVTYLILHTVLNIICLLSCFYTTALCPVLRQYLYTMTKFISVWNNQPIQIQCRSNPLWRFLLGTFLQIRWSVICYQGSIPWQVFLNLPLIIKDQYRTEQNWNLISAENKFNCKLTQETKNKYSQ